MTRKARASLRGAPKEATNEVDSGPAERTPERRCIVTRTVRPVAELIRFVRAPDDGVVADLKCRLPGRGVWVTARRWAVEEAVRRNLFARAFKGEARVDAELADEVGARLRDSALGALGLARRAGRLAIGFTEVDALLRRGGAVLLVHAAEAAPDGVRKLQQAAHAGGRRPETCRAFTVADLDLALGRSNVIHAALDEGGGQAAAARCRAYELYQRDRAPSGGDVAPGDGERTTE